MLGDLLLVAPVFSHDGNVNYYVPEGRWTNLLNGKVIEGPRWMREDTRFHEPAIVGATQFSHPNWQPY